MHNDSSLGQVISLSAKHPLLEVPDAPPDPGAGPAVLRDAVLAQPFDGAATGFVLACLPYSTAPVLWVQDRMSRRENGRLYGAGLPAMGFVGRVLRVEVSHPRDVLWAMEEGAACAGLAAVVGEIHGAPPVLDFTATKRLALRSEAAGVPVWLIRSGDPGTLSAARERWRVGSVRSVDNRFDAQAPGAPLWEAELFRARSRSPGTWIAAHDPRARDRADRLRFLSRFGDGPVATDHGAAADVAG
ncbi:hypothetical protein C1J03_02150 [Sulfitobacter sp. SK012]|uniref:ImuA family protein n=1 Tax=Sulfitobacter sp. SK012 TaxID=1389005 RepID=UPI000E0C67B3|nr:hypothetical protein [Sulfitobacter sp. SK012]AXI44940.1 hypothetical protein C1J03_02150 [Sulfitobacter sp. SK012]